MKMLFVKDHTVRDGNQNDAAKRQVYEAGKVYDRSEDTVKHFTDRNLATVNPERIKMAEAAAKEQKDAEDEAKESAKKEAASRRGQKEAASGAAASGSEGDAGGESQSQGDAGTAGTAASAGTVSATGSLASLTRPRT